MEVVRPENQRVILRGIFKYRGGSIEYREVGKLLDQRTKGLYYIDGVWNGDICVSL